MIVDILTQLRDTRPTTWVDAIPVMEHAAAEIVRLRRIEKAARAIRFSATPALGSGFVLTVTGGDVNMLEEALDGSAA